MYSFICLVHLADETSDAGDELAGLGGLVAPVMEGNFNGGDVIVRFALESEAAYRDLRPKVDAVLSRPDVGRADTVFFEHGKTGITEPGLAGGIWRGLLLAADRPQAPARMEQFETEIMLMPKYIPAIRNWRLSRVIEASGAAGWTHVWEQEYAELGGLMGPYMLHPYHWAMVDRWFDPECPDWIVNVQLCHTFAAFGRPVLS